MDSVEQGQVNQHADRYDEDEIQGLDNQEEEPACCDDHRVTTRACSQKKHKDGKFPRGDSREVKCYRVVAVSLWLLCVLLVIAVRVAARVATTYITDTQRLQSEIKRLNNEELLQARITNLTKENEKLMNSVCDWKCFDSSRYYISSDERNWTDSQQHCKDLQARLVIIDSKEEQEFIISQGKRAWIGLSDLETEGVWKWVDGTVLDKNGTGLDNNTRYWIAEEPKGGVYEGGRGNDEDCAEVRIAERSEEKSGWNDSVCEMKKHYICEKQTS